MIARHRAWLIGAGVPVLLFVLLWVLPTVTGPLFVDCGGREPAVCDQAWREVASDQERHVGPLRRLPFTHLPLLPATLVHIEGAIAERSGASRT